MSRSAGGKTRLAPARRVLLAEDDDEMRRLLEKVFRDAGFSVTSCGDGWSLLRHLSEYFVSPESRPTDPVDLIVSDVRMPGLTGVEILDGSSTIQGFPPMILITAFADAETHAAVRRAESVALFAKPVDLDILLNKARELISRTGSEEGHEQDTPKPTP